MSDVQDFYIRERGATAGTATKLVCIKVPKICCGKKIQVYHYANSLSSTSNGCSHMMTYNGIWQAYMVDKIHLSGQVRSISSTGLTCKSCKNYCPYADVSNQADGSFKCYSCRHPMK